MLCPELPDASRRFQTLPDASRRFQTLPDASRRFQTLPDAHSSQSLTVLLVIFDLGSWDVLHDPVLNAQSGRMFRRRKHLLNACRFDCPSCIINEDD
jgi:hypothetical protein